MSADMSGELPDSNLVWIHPEVKARLGQVRHALFDFDGTISTLRQGWEEVMAPMMVEAICGIQPPAAPMIVDAVCGGQSTISEIVSEVSEYIDRSTGILTIRQMEWLVEAVTRRGLNRNPQTPQAYKQIYLERLMTQVKQRIERLESEWAAPRDFSIQGSIEFTAGLAERGVKLYLASGTDHHFVMHEASALGLAPYFKGGVFGALDESDAHAKDRVIHEILERNQLSGSELLVVGDGPVELQEAARRGAVALGAATDEINRHGWNKRKIPRLVNAGADLLVPDFSNYQELIQLMTCRQ